MKKMLAILLSLLATMAFFGACGSSTSNYDSQGEDIVNRLDMTTLSENIESIAQYDFSHNKVFGSAYYVYQDGVALEKCYGTTSLNSDTPITNKTLFRLASMTKPITAVATMILVERGLLSLDDPIDMYIPAFHNVKIVDASGNESSPQNLPTVRNLLNHTSGIGGITKKLDSMTANDKATLKSSIAFYAKIGLDFEPGTRQMYSGYASFDVLTRIIEIASATDYLEFLTTEIFEPCGMVDTTFLPSSDQQSRIVDMHKQINGENAVAEMYPNCIFEDFPSTHYLGGAGLVSTLQDYTQFAKMLLNKGLAGNKRILKEETFSQLCTPQVSHEIMPYSERWGLGMRVITNDSSPLPKGSFGWSGAYGSHFWIDPTNKIFAVFMKNSRIDGGAGNESAVNLEQAVYTACKL